MKMMTCRHSIDILDTIKPEYYVTMHILKLELHLSENQAQVGIIIYSS